MANPDPLKKKKEKTGREKGGEITHRARKSKSEGKSDGGPKKLKKELRFEKTAVIPELSREAFAGDEEPEDTGFRTTEVGAYGLTREAKIKMWLQKWALVIVSALVVLIFLLWKLR